MDPRRLSRGDEAGEELVYTVDWLQWIRGVSAAVTSARMSASTEEPELQWIRGVSAAVTTCLDACTSRRSMLQWIRGVSAAVTRK